LKSQGYSLIELIVVLGIVATLLATVALNFESWQKKNMVERYTKELYADIQNARMQAAFKKKRQRVEFPAALTGIRTITFKSYSGEGDAVGAVVATKQLPVPLSRNSGWSNPSAYQVEFDVHGVMNDSACPTKVLCFFSESNATYDAVIISPILTNMGKIIDQGVACGPTNVTQK